MTIINAKKRGCGNNFCIRENLNEINDYHRKTIEPFEAVIVATEDLNKC